MTIINALEGRVEEGYGALVFEITRDSRLDEALTVDYESVFLGNGTIRFEPGQDRVRVSFGYEEDDLDLPNSPYELTLVNGDGYTLTGKISVSGEFIDNDGMRQNTPPEASDLTFDDSEEWLEAEWGYYIAPYAIDHEADNLTYRVVEQPSQGTFAWDEAAFAFRFNPNPGAFDTLDEGESDVVTFKYVANDGTADSNVATVTINVFGVTDATMAATTNSPDGLPVRLDNTNDLLV